MLDHFSKRQTAVLRAPALEPVSKEFVKEGYLGTRIVVPLDSIRFIIKKT